MPPQVNTVLVNDRVISEASVSVQLTRAGNTGPIAPGTTLEVGDVIATGPDAQAVLLLENGAIEVVILEDSEIRISSLWVSFGEIFVRVIDDLRETFEVESEYGLAGVEGTVFAVRVPRGSPSGVNYECVTLEGRVRIRSPTGAWSPVDVAAGNAVTIEQGRGLARRDLQRGEFNNLVDRMNRVERIYRPENRRLLAPDVVGLTEAGAKDELVRRGYTAGTSVARVTENVPIGQVLAQQPAAGREVERGAQFVLDVEAEPTTVPPLVGTSEAAALRLLAGARLKAGETVRQITGNAAVGEVLRQQPLANARVPIASTVNLWVEAESVRVPSVLNSSIATAHEALADSSLAAGAVTERLQTSGPYDVVIEQSTAAGTPVAPGTRIDLVVAAQGIPVPNLANATASNARSTLSSAGFRLGRSSSRRGTSAPGAVIEQDPAAGTLAKPGSAVDIVTDSGCTVPLVTGMHRDAATSAVQAAGLSPSIRSVGIYNSNHVTLQQPVASGPIRCGTTVYLDLGTNIG